MQTVVYGGTRVTTQFVWVCDASFEKQRIGEEYFWQFGQPVVSLGGTMMP
jgi:hypothetical protein